MNTKRALFFTVCGPLFLALTACQPDSQNMEDSEAEFLMSSAGKDGVPGFTPQGWGWKPGSRVEISLFNEPDSQGKPNPSWKKILDEKVDPSSLFGFSSNPGFYPVRRKLCGNPAPRQFMLVMAKNTDTGKIRIRPLPVDLYFTFQPCPLSGVAIPETPPPER